MGEGRRGLPVGHRHRSDVRGAVLRAGPRRHGAQAVCRRDRRLRKMPRSVSRASRTALHQRAGGATLSPGSDHRDRRADPPGAIGATDRAAQDLLRQLQPSARHPGRDHRRQQHDDSTPRCRRGSRCRSAAPTSDRASSPMPRREYKDAIAADRDRAKRTAISPSSISKPGDSLRRDGDQCREEDGLQSQSATRESDSR